MHVTSPGTVKKTPSLSVLSLGQLPKTTLLIRKKEALFSLKRSGRCRLKFFDRLHTWLLIQSRLTTLLTSLIARRQVGPQTE